MRYPRYDFVAAARTGPPTASERLAIIRRLKEGHDALTSDAGDGGRVASSGEGDAGNGISYSTTSTQRDTEEFVGSSGLFGEDDDI
jgi:hypothetical protein